MKVKECEKVKKACQKYWPQTISHKVGRWQKQTM